MEGWELGLDIEALLIENEIMYLAKEYNVSVTRVREIMAEVGNNRREIEKRLLKNEGKKNP